MHRRAARTLHRTLWWQNKKMQVLIVAAVLLVLYMVIAVSCGPTLSQCY